MKNTAVPGKCGTGALPCHPPALAEKRQPGAAVLHKVTAFIYRSGIVCIALTCFLSAFQAHAAIPTFQDLMDPMVFPEAQRGLLVESVVEKEGAVTITTTGAVVVLDERSGTVAFRQRIGGERSVAMMYLGCPLAGVKVTHSGAGFARVTIDAPKLTLRVNGDSLCMLQAHAPLRAAVRTEIAPAWNASWKNNHLIVDELGGFGLYCSDLELKDQYDPYGTPVATYSLPENAVLAVGVCPPKPYDWERSLREQVIWHWSNLSSYPPDEDLRSWKPHGNVVLLQSEVMLWKDWNLDFVPRLGMDEWNRVRDTIHGMGIPYIVYTSPFYFLKGTSQEKNAVNDKPGVCPGAIVDGENMDLFLDAITRVMGDLKPDGLYFDGQYAENPAALYALARHARRIVGEGGILEWHTTVELGKWGSLMYMPQADAYTDIQLRGEGSDQLYGDFDYLRYFVSSYNINNCIGVLCNNSGKPMTVPQLESVLQANARLHTLLGMSDFLDKEYRPRLTPEYHAEVDRLVAGRQQQSRAKADATAVFLKGPQTAPPTAVAFEFDQMPEAEKLVSPLNSDALSLADGALHVKGHASTYAYLQLPVNKAAGGVEIKLRHGSDGGMSWGPAAMVKWDNGEALRIGTRSDGVLQVDLPPVQTLGPAFDPNAWVWLRARWHDKTGVVEFGTDGEHFIRFDTFPFAASGHAVAELLVGKVPCHGKPDDYTEPGGIGECDIDYVRLYAE